MIKTEAEEVALDKGSAIKSETEIPSFEECNVNTSTMKIEKHKSCSICDMKTYSTYQLNDHVREVHNGVRFICFPCNKHFKYLRLYVPHMKSHDANLKEKCCKICNIKTYSTSHLNEHVQDVHNGYRYVCFPCNQQFKYIRDYTFHMKTHDAKLEPKKKRCYTCSICSTITFTLTQLQKHIADVHDGFRNICFPCNKSFKYIHFFNAHMETHSPTYAPQEFRCYKCNATFNIRYEHTKHLKTHNAENGFVCDICGKKVTTSDSFRNHRMTHTGEKPLDCETCGKKFKNKKYMILHVRTHTKEKPYSCEVCGQCFTQLSSLNVHRRLHSGDRPYICVICQKCFITRYTLKMHTKKIHGKSLDGTKTHMSENSNSSLVNNEDTSEDYSD